MANTGEKFDGDKIVEIFERVGLICEKEGIYLEIAVHGGSSLMLNTKFDASSESARRITEDIDYIPIKTDGEDFERILNQATQDLGFSDQVFRDDVSDFVDKTVQNDFFAQYPQDSGNFRVFNAPMEYILAMKSVDMRSAFSSSDPEDVWKMLSVLDIETIEQVSEICDKYLPFKPLSDTNKLIINDLIQEKSLGGHYNPMLAWSN